MFDEPQTSVEQVSVIFLDRSKLFLNETSKNVFEEFDDCLLHISQLTSTKAILMVCGSINMTELLTLHELAHLKTIFWKTTTADECEYLQTTFVKLKIIGRRWNNFDDPPLFRNGDSLSLSFSYEKNDQERSTTKLNGQFLHSQLMIDCLLRMKPEAKEKEDFVRFFRNVYHDDSRFLTILDEFATDYCSAQALTWYTKEIFLYQALNKALRTQDVDLLFLYRFFLRDIDEQLKLNQMSSPIRVYRRSLLPVDEFQWIQHSIGQIIALNSLSSTSMNREFTIFCMGESVADPGFAKVLFEIDLDPHIDGGKPFANIVAFSEFPIEQEVLIMLGSTFLITAVEIKDHFNIVQMKSCQLKHSSIQALIDKRRNDYGINRTNLLLWAVTLHEMGKFDQAEKFYWRLINERSDILELVSICYHALGSVASERGDYETSLKLNYQSLETRRQSLNCDPSNLAYNYNSLGVIYQKTSDYERALKFYRKAFVIWRRICGDQDSKVAMCLNNMGGAYQAKENLTEALRCYQQALAIWEINLPPTCFHLGVCHNNIACIHGCLTAYDQAMFHLQKSIEIYHHSLPFEHAAIAKTLENIALVYFQTLDTEKSLEFYSKAATMYRRTLAETHPKLIKIQTDIDYVRNGKQPSGFHFWWLDSLKILPLDD